MNFNNANYIDPGEFGEHNQMMNATGPFPNQYQYHQYHHQHHPIGQQDGRRVSFMVKLISVVGSFMQFPYRVTYFFSVTQAAEREGTALPSFQYSGNLMAENHHSLSDGMGNAFALQVENIKKMYEDRLLAVSEVFSSLSCRFLSLQCPNVTDPPFFLFRPLASRKYGAKYSQ